MKLDIFVYNSQHIINNIALHQLNHLNIASFSFIFLSGLFTSFSPCLISILPICILYITGENQSFNQTQTNKIQNLFLFCLGTISSFTTLGTISLLVTGFYSEFFDGIPVISALIIIYMGFSLLNIVPLNTINFNKKVNTNSQSIKMYLSGIGIGLAISSCSTPIFITLLIWINSNQKPLIGFIFIIIYSIGYIFPIIIGSIFSSKFLQIVSNPLWNRLWAPFSGTVLLSAGTFSLLSNVFKSG